MGTFRFHIITRAIESIMYLRKMSKLKFIMISVINMGESVCTMQARQVNLHTDPRTAIMNNINK